MNNYSSNIKLRRNVKLGGSGGDDGSGAPNSDMCWRLNVESGEWAELIGGPSPRFGCSAAAVDGYAITQFVMYLLINCLSHCL